MYPSLLAIHSLFRWLVLISLVIAIYKAYRGLKSNKQFTKIDNLLRHWTATIAHIQLTLGILIYSQSPIIKYFWHNTKEAVQNMDTAFFGVIHLLLMLIAIIIITIGSSLAKRRATGKEKFRTILIYYSIALLLIFIAIPWPFSPLANRPYLRLN
jgi:hypothetical protein